MYEQYYGMKEKPFNLLPDPEYLFMSKEHENTYTHLDYAVSENKGFVVVTGEIGSGKTTLINFLLNKIGQGIQIGLINNTFLTPDQLLKMICQEFELNVNGHDKAGIMDIFHQFLLEQFAESRRVILFIDEAQNLTPKGLEEIRMLSNLESEKHHLIQIILVGQPELKLKLQRRDLEQFSQRVSVYCHLKPLQNGEVTKYIHYRLKAGGASNPDLFQAAAIDEITRYSRGIPRLINMLCDTALVYGFADSKAVIDAGIIRDVVAAREIGGVHSQDSRDDPAPQTSEPGRNNGGEPGASRGIARVAYLEKRLELMEERMSGLERKLNHLGDLKDKRDEFTIELMKMLKASMENRVQTIGRFFLYKKKMEQARLQTIRPPSEMNSLARSRMRCRKGLVWALGVIYFLAFSILCADRLIAPVDVLWMNIRRALALG